jgi:hypothetical protein
MRSAITIASKDQIAVRRLAPFAGLLEQKMDYSP